MAAGDLFMQMMKVSDSWGQELIDRAESGHSDISVLREEFGRWSVAKQDELRRITETAKAADRDLLADEQRRFNAIAKDIGLVGVAIGTQLALDAEAKRNRERVFGRADDHGAQTEREWKSIFPSMGEYKSQQTSTDPSGGYLVTADAGPFFDRLRPDSVILQAGPRIELCESDALEVPILTGSTTVQRTSENGDITASSVTFGKGRIPMVKYATYTIGSSEWFADAAYGPRQIIEMDHRQQLAAKLDQEFLQGNGTALVGLRHSGTATSRGAAGNGPTFDSILDALYRMEANNAKPGAIFMHPRTWNTLRKSQDAQSRYQLAPDPTQSAERRLFNIPVYLSTQISITETSDNGANTDCSYIVVADMRYVVVARRSEVQILYDPFSYAQSDRIALRSTTRWGLGVIHAAAVEVLTGVRA
jgi:HK97 family phage major capsid protein